MVATSSRFACAHRESIIAVHSGWWWFVASCVRCVGSTFSDFPTMNRALNRDAKTKFVSIFIKRSLWLWNVCRCVFAVISCCNGAQTITSRVRYFCAYRTHSLQNTRADCIMYVYVHRANNTSLPIIIEALDRNINANPLGCCDVANLFVCKCAHEFNPTHRFSINISVHVCMYKWVVVIQTHAIDRAIHGLPLFARVWAAECLCARTFGLLASAGSAASPVYSVQRIYNMSDHIAP